MQYLLGVGAVLARAHRYLNMETVTPSIACCPRCNAPWGPEPAGHACPHCIHDERLLAFVAHVMGWQVRTGGPPFPQGSGPMLAIYPAPEMPRLFQTNLGDGYPWDPLNRIQDAWELVTAARLHGKMGAVLYTLRLAMAVDEPPYSNEALWLLSSQRSAYELSLAIARAYGYEPEEWRR